MLDHGVVQAGGRLNRFSKAFSQKHLIITRTDHHVAQIKIEDHHRKVGHCSMASIWTSLSKTFWVVISAATVRKVLGNLFFVNGETNLRDHKSSQTYPLSD